MKTTNEDRTVRIIPVQFRWPVKQVADSIVEVRIPLGLGGEPVLNPAFVEQQKLTDQEIDIAEDAALRKIVVRDT